MPASRLNAYMDAEVTKDSVCHVAIKIAGYSLAIRATCIQELCVPAKRIGDSMLMTKSFFSAVPSAIDTHAAAFDGHFFPRNIFDFMGHDYNLEIVL